MFFCPVLLCLCARLFICALWSPAGKGLTSWLSFVVSTVSLSLSHWYPGSGEVLDCIDSWSLHLAYFVNTLLTAQVQSDLNKLSAEASVEHSSISVDKCDDLEIVCTRCSKKGSLTALRRCTGFKSSSYCSKDCQRSDWPLHKHLCKSIQSQTRKINCNSSLCT